MIEFGDLSEKATFYPTEENLGKECQFWNVTGRTACDFPKWEMREIDSCQGIVNDACLYVKDGRDALSLTLEQKIELKTRIPDEQFPLFVPPGYTI